MTRKSKSIIEADDFKNSWRHFSKNWYYFVFFPAIAFFLAYIYKNKVVEVYEAKTQVLLRSNDIYRYQEPIYKTIGYYEEYQDVINQMRVIRSANLISKTIDRLNLDISYFIIGRLKTIEVYNGIPFAVEASIFTPSFFENEFHIKITDTAHFEMTYDKKGVTVKRNGTFGEPVVSSDFSVFLKKTHGYVTPEDIDNLRQINYMFKCHNHQYLMSVYQGNLNVINDQWSAIMDISLKDVIPDRAVAFLDTLADEYIKYTIQSQIQINENTLTYIDKQMDEVEGILSAIEKDLDTYKDERAILDLTREQNEYFNKLVDYESNARSLQIELQTVDALEKYITSTKDQRLLPPSFYILENDDYLKTTLNELYKLQITANGILWDETGKSLSIDEINNKIQLLKDDLLEYINNTRKAISSKISAVTEQIKYYEGMLRGIPRTERQMLNFRRKLDVNEKLYSYLLERRANTIITRAGIVPDTKVIESPYITGIVEPDEKRIYYSFLIVGLVVALIATFIRSIFFDNVESVEELKNITKLPVLGDIPHIKNVGDKYIVVDANPRALITESYRLIRTNLDYFATSEKSKTILITSNNPSEGKTFCNINLGVILAKAGKKTIIIELDLHKPKLSKVFNLTPDHGISHYLTGKAPVEGLKQYSGIDNLDVIPAGTVPPNPSELILSDRIPALLEQLKLQYDYILVDTPPVGVITDTLVLMRYADVNLFVISAKKPNVNDILATHQIVDDNRITNFGFILNQVKSRKARYYYRHYRYNYSYMYGNDLAGKVSGNGLNPAGEKTADEKKI